MFNKKPKILNKFFSSIALIGFLTTFTGCARYSALSLSDISTTNSTSTQFSIAALNESDNHSLAERDIQKLSNFALYSLPNENVLMVSKVFDREDCNRYFDRNVLAKGYQPIQIQIHNNSKNNLVFSPNKINLPLAPAQEVARQVYTSTATRVTLYAVGSLVIPLLIVPAIVDGMKSQEANALLTQDFDKKTAKNEVIGARSSLNTIIFVPKHDFDHAKDISITLIDSETGKPLVLTNTF